MKILIIDDDGMAREALKAAVKIFYPDAAVELAENANAALILIDRELYAVIMIDIGLRHGQTGLELLDTIRKGDSKSTPVLMVSGRDDINNIVTAFDLGANGFLTKQIFSFAELNKALAALLAGGSYWPSDASESLGAGPGPSGRWNHLSLRDCIQSWPDERKRLVLLKYRGALDKRIAAELNVSESALRRKTAAVHASLRVNSHDEMMVLFGDNKITQNLFANTGTSSS